MVDPFGCLMKNIDFRFHHFLGIELNIATDFTDQHKSILWQSVKSVAGKLFSKRSDIAAEYLYGNSKEYYTKEFTHRQ